MAIDIGFDWKQKFESENAVMNQLQSINDDLEGAVSAELDAVMQKVLAAAIDLCPKDTGALASSINLEGGAISAGSDFYEANIYAGSEDVINPKTFVPTSQYAMLVHDGHVSRDGKTMYEGVPFLTEALLMYEEELENAVGKAMQELLRGSD
ncbi:MAG: HK97 gp10 family phage protein [Candidatus Bathyarchaeia archaeon]|jgi:hypothetical protein